MILLVDIGSSTLQWAFDESNMLTQKGQVTYPENRIDMAMQALFSALTLKPKSVYVALGVKGSYQDEVASWMKTLWNVVPVFVNSEHQADVLNNPYPFSEPLAAHRWCALLGASERVSHAPSMIVWADRQISIDIMTGDGIYEGGFIVPGLKLMQESLAVSAAHKTPEQDQRHALLPTTAQQSIQLGSMYMLASYIERLHRDMSRDFKEECQILVGGADADAIIPLLTMPLIVTPYLVIEGLMVVASMLEGIDSSSTEQLSPAL